MISKRLIFILVFLSCMLAFSSAVADPFSEQELDEVLSSAENVFKAMKARQYKDIWPSLTEKTKRSIIHAVCRESTKAGKECNDEKVEADFRDGGTTATTYWDAYLSVFNPDTVLEESKWTFGTLKKDKVEINILYKKSERPAVLQLFREEHRWKVGLDETFGARNLLPF